MTDFLNKLRQHPFTIRATKPWLLNLPDFVAQQKLITKPNPTIFDVGANVGQTTEKYLYYFHEATIYGFEPFPESFNTYQSRFSQFPSVIANNVALAPKNGKALFHQNKCDYTNSFLKPIEAAKRLYHDNDDQLTQQSTLTVKTITLDHFAKEHAIKYIDILKMDTEGGELLVLEGAKKLLKQQAIDIIFSEVLYSSIYENQPLMHEVWRWLEDNNYVLFNLYNLSPATNGKLIAGDAIFLSPQAQKRLSE